ncbi:MAG: UvrD-helicase domain-containing protein [Alistipes sp.]
MGHGPKLPERSGTECRSALKRLLAKLCSIYDNNIRFLNTTRLLSANYRSFALLDDLSEKVTEICTEQNLVPISETNAILGKLMGDNDAPFIYEKVGNTFSRFMIDEFQDTSQGQWSNFVPLLENAVAQSEDEPVLLVGDVKQSIYRWRGGDWRILGRQVASRFEDTRTASLDTNYRSEKTVVEFNNSLIEACVRLDNDRLNRMVREAAENGHLSPERLDELSDMLSEAYRDQRQRCSKTREAGYVTVREYEKGEQPDPPLLIRTVEDLQSRGFAAGTSPYSCGPIRRARP